MEKNNMSLLDLIGTAMYAIRGTYKLATIILDSEKTNTELKGTIGRISTDLTVVGGLLAQLQNFAHRVAVNDEQFLTHTIVSLSSVVNNIQTSLEEVQRDRGFIQRLFLRRSVYENQLRESVRHLFDLCGVIQRAIPTITKIEIPRREFPDFRRLFRNTPEKELSFYDFSMIKNTPNTILTIASEEFHTMKCLCYMKVGNEQFFIGYQLRTWSALNPVPMVLSERRRKFAESWRQESVSDLTESNSSLNSPSSTYSILTQSNTPPAVAATSDNISKKLDFTEFFMSHDDICGMTLTQSNTYIATKCEITIVSLTKQSIIAQYGIEGNGPNTFKHISSIYISPNDETNLYIVDRGQYAVHQYIIDDSGLRFEYKHRYVVVANVNEQCHLISCTIYNRNLYVSDDANHCLHVFSLNGERQSFYLTDNLITPFSPGSLCSHGKYLYVTNCSAESPGIIVFDEECQPVDWYRNQSLQEILAIDIDPNINELYVLTTKRDKVEQRRRPLIVSMDLCIHSEQS